MKQVQITSDGGCYGTKVIDTDTGSEIHGITSLSVAIKVDDINRARIELGAVSLDVKATPEFYVIDPVDGQMKSVKRIEYADGTVREFGCG